MKIITGTAKGMNIETLEGEATRPTSQRVKEAIFSMIQFEIENTCVLDLFAGSGQMGLESLSRGAKKATFCDASRDAVDIVIKNAKKTKLFDKFTRVDSTLTRTTRGTGLGLYIVKGLAKAMNININLECDDDFKMILKFNDYVK